MKKVSILIPIYNVEKYIEQCANSLFSQTYTHIEYIFVNDKTQDNSIDLLEKCIEQYPQRHEHIKIIHHKANSGLGLARKTALEAATGEYITFCRQ